MCRRVCFLVRMEGLEPPCLAALDPKSSASTNFATSAKHLRFLNVYTFFYIRESCYNTRVSKMDCKGMEIEIKFNYILNSFFLCV